MIDSYLEKVSARPNIICETNSMEVMLGAITESGVCTIVPEHGLRRDERYQVIPLREPIPVRTSALLWPKHSFRSALARTFGQMMRDRFLSGR